MKMPVQLCSGFRSLSKSEIKAFSLVELLVVLGVIAILAAISFPLFNTAVARAKVAKCTSNLRAIAPAFQNYLAENNMRLPWRYEPDLQIGYKDRLAEYLSDDLRVFICPEHQTIDFPAQSSYGMNYFYDHVNALQVSSNSNTILLAEVAGSSDRGTHRAHRDSEAPGQLASERHRGKSNYLFFDGSIRLLDYRETISPIDMWGENLREEEEG